MCRPSPWCQFLKGLSSHCCPAEGPKRRARSRDCQTDKWTRTRCLCPYPTDSPSLGVLLGLHKVGLGKPAVLSSLPILRFLQSHDPTGRPAGARLWDRARGTVTVHAAFPPCLSGLESHLVPSGLAASLLRWFRTPDSESQNMKQSLQGLLASPQRLPPSQPPVGAGVQVQRRSVTHVAQMGGQIQLQ